MWLRGIAVWIGAAIAGSFLGSAARELLEYFYYVFGPATDLDQFLGRAVATLPFTVVGSTLLSLAYDAMARRGLRAPWLYAALMVFGMFAGAVMLSWAGWVFSLIGAGYAVITTTAWLGLLVVLRMNRVSEAA